MTKPRKLTLKDLLLRIEDLSARISMLEARTVAPITLTYHYDKQPVSAVAPVYGPPPGTGQPPPSPPFTVNCSGRKP